jgi:hypothetical protein
MISDAVKVAKINARAIREAKQLDLVKTLATNPIVELLAGIVAISYLNKGSQSWLESITGIDLRAGSEYTGLVTIIALQQLGPSGIQAIAGTTGAAFGAITKALPLLAAAA